MCSELEVDETGAGFEDEGEGELIGSQPAAPHLEEKEHGFPGEVTLAVAADDVVPG